MARIIGEVRPAGVFVENSPLLVQRGLAVVLGDLAQMGYDARWCVLGADDAGAPHRRKRIWIVAHASELFCNGSNDNTGIHERSEEISESGNSSRTQGISWWLHDPAEVADTGCEHERERNTTGVEADTRQRTDSAISYKPGSQRQGRERPTQPRLGRMVDELARWLDGPEAAFGGTIHRVAQNVPNRVNRLKAIGNGQVPATVRLAWQTLTTP